MLNELKAWIELTFGSAYRYSMGQWVDTPDTASSYYCSIQHDGGAPVDVEDRKQRFRIILLGPQNGRDKASTIIADINSLIDFAMTGTTPCGAASIRAVGEPVGPSYTTENRPWASVNFELIF